MHPLYKSLQAQQHWLRMIPNPWIINLATLGPLGRAPKAPGTLGSIGALAIYVVILHYAGNWWLPLQILVWAITLYLAILICGEAEQRLAKRDPGEIVLDEAVAIPLCYIGLTDWLEPGRLPFTLLAGFILFRTLDIAKPYGIRKLQRYPGGLGVVLDDVVAALYTNLILHAAKLGWTLYTLS